MLQQQLQQAALQEGQSPTEQFGRLLKNGSTKSLSTRVPLEYVDPSSLSFELQIQRGEFDQRFQRKGLMFGQSYYSGTKTKYSSTPLDQLKIVHVNEMRLGERHKGTFLLCRIISPPLGAGRVVLGVEDPNGWAQLISLYNFPGTFEVSGKELDTMFPLYSILAIREPTAIPWVGEHSHVRIDSPSDILFLKPSDPILANVGWTTGVLTPHMANASAKEWKSVGDAHFKKKQFFAAAVAYSNGLDEDPSSTTIRLNRCLAHIRLTNFVFAAHDAQMVLSQADLDPADRTKALYRAALAQYGSGKYREAQQHYNECLIIDPDLREAINGVNECRIRIQEQEHGIYDWEKLFMQGEVPHATPNVADYTGPVKVSSMPHRGGGRGLITTKDIAAGELLLVSKAFAVSFPSESDQGGRGIWAQCGLLHQTITKIAGKDHLSTPLLDLYAGQSSVRAPPALRRVDDQRSIGNPMKFSTDIDPSHIDSIMVYNAFGLPTVSLMIDFNTYSQSREDTPSALYTYPSFINHSCVGNATRVMHGHVMVVRAVMSIAAGEEITMSYCCSEVSFPERMNILTSYFKDCDCSLCVSDRAAGPGFHEALAKAEERTQNPELVSPKVLRELVAQVDALYPASYYAYRSASYGAHHRLARCLQLEVLKGTNEVSHESLCREAIQHECIALEALGLNVTDKNTTMIQPPSTTQISLPVELNYIPRNPNSVGFSCWAIIECFMKMGNEWRAEMWLRVVLWFEDKSFGGRIPLFRIRHANILKAVGPSFEALLEKIERTP